MSSRNLPKWWSPRRGHGAVLAASKPLKVSKYIANCDGRPQNAVLQLKHRLQYVHVS